MRRPDDGADDLIPAIQRMTPWVEMELCEHLSDAKRETIDGGDTGRVAAIVARERDPLNLAMVIGTRFFGLGIEGERGLRAAGEVFPWRDMTKPWKAAVLPETLTVEWPESSRKVLFFAPPPGTPPFTSCPIAAGLRLLGVGERVLVPPSRLATGGCVWRRTENSRGCWSVARANEPMLEALSKAVERSRQLQDETPLTPKALAAAMKGTSHRDHVNPT
jgi:hypothetical protein